MGHTTHLTDGQYVGDDGSVLYLTETPTRYLIQIPVRGGQHYSEVIEKSTDDGIEVIDDHSFIWHDYPSHTLYHLHDAC